MRSGWTVEFLENTRQDLVYAVRGLRRNPAFALTAILSLALGIGASVSIFTVADNLLIRPLPYHDPGPPGDGVGDQSHAGQKRVQRGQPLQLPRLEGAEQRVRKHGGLRRGTRRAG